MTQLLSQDADTKSYSLEKGFIWQGAKLLPSFVVFMLGFGLWLMPVPEGLSSQVWQLFAIFAATIAGIITLPLPLGSVVFFGMMSILLSRTLSFQELFLSYAQPSIWMIITAFFLTGGVIKTNLAQRLSFLFLSGMGNHVMSLAYGFVFCELLIAPFVPSIVARSSCIIFPIILSIVKDINPCEKGQAGFKTAGFLLLVALHTSVISSCMFMTSMSGNLMMAEMAFEQGIFISWGGWALSSIVPGLVSLLATPWIIYSLYRPDIEELPNAREKTGKQLEALGPVSFQEYAMGSVFILVLGLWLFGSQIGVSNVEACFLGLGLLLFLGVISWEDCLKNETAWNTFFWLGALMGISAQLKKLGLFSWLGSNVLGFIGQPFWPFALLLVLAIYFYSHYFFASNVAHVTALYPTFLLTALELGAPPYLAALLLAFLSSLFGGLTHYACASGPVFFSSGYIDLKKWWQIGFVCSTFHFLNYLILGSAWLKFLSLW